MNLVLGKIDADICPMIKQLRLKGRETTPLFKFWDDFLTKVPEPLNLYLASSRHSIWESNHYSKCQLLSFFVATKRSSYARYMSYMLLQENNHKLDLLTLQLVSWLLQCQTPVY